MAETILGIETEYGFALIDNLGMQVERGQAASWLFEAARQKLTGLPDGSSRLFLSNGALLYIDCGAHPEYASAEACHPDEVVRSVRQGDRIMGELADGLTGTNNIVESRVFKTNIDYLDPTVSWGCHESYLYRQRWVGRAPQIIPHLISRIIYTGAGGFKPDFPGIAFSLSPRVQHIEHELSDESTNSRGIFHTKNETLSEKAYNRLHIICGDSSSSELCLWLKLGTTALVVAMTDHGIKPGDAVRLTSPVAAFHRIAGDVNLTTPLSLARGGTTTALAIQYHYLALAEQHQHADFMPPWAPAVCRRWRQMLDTLVNTPQALSTRIDWAIKLQVYRDFALSRFHLDEQKIALWNRIILRMLHSLPQFTLPPETVDITFITNCLRKSSRVGRIHKRQSALLTESGMDWDDLQKFNELRLSLLALDTRYGQLGSSGLFNELDEAGVLNHRVLSPENSPGDPMTVLPKSGRARVRGECIKRLAEDTENYQCSWERIVGDNRWLDLADPFANAEVWKTNP